MQNMLILILLIIIFVTATTTSSDPIVIKNKQKYTYTKLKSIDCGTFSLDELTEDENIDNLVINLTLCLNDRYPSNLNHQSNIRISYSTHLTSRTDQIFNKYFQLDVNTGRISQIKPIDREYICLTYQKTDDSIDCDCKSDKCEFKFKFNAFKEINKKTQHYHLILTIKLNDLNDNIPTFKQNYLYLNISEFIGVNTIKSESTKIKSTICPYSSRLKRDTKNINDDFLLSNTLIPLETNAIDLDSDKYSNIRYDLVLLKSKSCTLVSEMKDNFDFVKSELYESTDCNNEFELVEANLNENYMQLQNILFLKVNKYLDREVQDCYNFILIATDKQVNETLIESLKENNYMMIKLTITDLNDNIPRFEEAKYVFDLNETTDLLIDETNQESYYFNLLKETCSSLKLKVKAVDLDLDLNGQINYRIIQQVHRKNLNHKINLNKIFDSDVDLSESLDPDALFTVNKQNGNIYLKVCENLNKFSRQSLSRLKYLELIMLLDFELYTKHILVVEAIDSSIHNPLQSFVTVEINIHDLNDQAPHLVSLFNTQCSVNSHSNNNKIDISIQNYKLNTSPTLNSRIYSAKLIIDGLSEWTTKSSCLGQFLITDLDTPRTNGKLDAILVDINDHTRISNEFVIRNVKNSIDNSNDMNSVTSQHEIFEIFLNFEPDAEQQRDYKYTLILSDNGALIRLKSFIEVIVLIKDENDNEPRFEQQSYLFKIDEWYYNPDLDDDTNSNADLTINSNNNILLPHELITNYCFGQVEAFDLDKSNVSSSISYEFIYLDQNDRDLFYYNTTNGYICVTNRTLLDREKKNRYTFILYAINSLSANKLNSSVQIDVYLNDLNDNRPQFPVRDYSFFVAETDSNLINTLLISEDNYSKKNNKKLKYYKQDHMNYIGQIQATDKDIYLNADLKYYFKQKDNNLLELNMNNLEKSYLTDENLILENEPNRKSKFKQIRNIDELLFINSTNGKLYLLKGIDREQITHIRFNVYVTDRRSAKSSTWPNEPLVNSVPVVIEFIDINDSKPTCTNLDLYPVLQQNYNTYIFSLYFNLNQFKQYEPFIIYNLQCSDNDMAKNSELTYELIDITFKEIDGYIDNSNKNNELPNAHQLVSNLFQVDSRIGVLNFNINKEWLANYNDTSLIINPIYLNIFNNYFFVLKFKVSDNGMIASFNYYTLKLRFCFNLSLKYCELVNSQSAETNQTNHYMLKFVMQKLTNVDEEFFNTNEDNSNTQDDFNSKETDNDLDDVNFLNEEDRLLNEILINNKTSLKNSHPYPNSYSSSSTKISFNYLYKYLFFIIFRWLCINC